MSGTVAAPGTAEGAAAPPPTIWLSLAKEDFKFSSAHFTIFGDDDAELLHGHNYQVGARLGGRRLDSLGFLVDVAPVKRQIRALCSELDERVLIPARCTLLEIDERDGETHLHFAERHYCFPAADVLRLPLRNITIEELSRHFWQLLAPRLPAAIEWLELTIGETSGQQASWCAACPGPGSEG